MTISQRGLQRGTITGPGPDRQQHGDRRAERNRLLRPAVIGAEVIEEERDVVVRKAAGDAEGEEAAGDDPGAAKWTRFGNQKP